MALPRVLSDLDLLDSKTLYFIEVPGGVKLNKYQYP